MNAASQHGGHGLATGRGRVLPARVAWIALALVMALGLALAAPARALAAGDETAGSVTVTAHNADEPHTYTAWRLFAGVVTGSGGEATITDATWDGCMPAAFYQALDGAPYQTAQDALLAVTAGVRGQQEDSYVVQLSRLAVQYPDAATATLSTDEAATLPEGLYLFASEDAQPFVAAVSPESPLEVHEKSTPPGVDKQVGQVADDGSVTYGVEVTASYGRDIPYRLEGTLPSNYASFDTYAYAFHDTLSEGLAADLSSVRVTLVHPDDTTEEVPADAYTATLDGQQLDVSFPDLKAAVPAASYGDTVRVDYTARLVPGKAVLGLAEGNPNEVRLEYRRSPSYDGTGETNPVRVRVYSFALSLVKKDATADKALAGASFALRGADGLYLASDGTWVDDASAAARVTGDDGTARFEGLAPGTYALVEVAAPDGYQALEGEISLTLEADLSAQSLTLSATSADAKVSAVSAATGVATLEVTNQPTPSKTPSWLPVTGDASVTVAWIVGIAAVAAAIIIVAVVLRRRSRNDAQAGGGK